ncbi:polysaccharide deacetylase family protein [Rhizobium halophytocola]|uniref:Chitooligosaccharide deacetylase n=1 Tax=Rhizobium halophytocola TaxID=735519 RepID=A0ABS4DWT2_9HYPH|nr:polysaccharide deacetylase family protein [Rhizobium halophytocola]MBP1850156.1 peptidoglycan/xylan/chitin deacetylase (PgdA/CDA1 family) [Rhizobium halophytocola]
MPSSKMRLLALGLAAVTLVPGAASARGHDGLIEPSLTVSHGDAAHPHVALTFDACSGHTDMRILDTLFAERIPATIFVTGRWLKRNGDVVKRLKTRPDLFEIENHGLNHVPAVDHPASIYGIAAAGSARAVAEEVEGGAAAITAAGFPAPHVFRGATALYTRSALVEINTLGFAIGGFSLNGDQGASLPAATVTRRISAARDGDVVIAHINQPGRASGAGVAAAIRALKARGTVFVRLDQGRQEPAALRPAALAAVTPAP